jgi:UDP-2,3-diacylglucosamine pyrophosphatase LpxH
MQKSRTWIERIEPPLPARIWAAGPGDVHLAAENRSKALIELLHPLEMKVLVLNGDFLDHTNVRRLCRDQTWLERRNKLVHSGRLRQVDQHVIRLIEAKRRTGTRIVLNIGNHDVGMQDLFIRARSLALDDVERRNPHVREILKNLLLIENWELREELLLERNGIKFYITHGDRWDHIVHSKHAITGLGSFFWEHLKRIEREKQHVAHFAKRQVKLWTKISQQVAAGAITVARYHGAQYALAGHTHHAERKHIDGIDYVNIGSFDLHESGFFTITPEGVFTLHTVYTRHKQIANPRRANVRM